MGSMNTTKSNPREVEVTRPETVTWYIEHQSDPFVAKLINTHCRREDERKDVLCSDGVRRRLFVCSPALLEKLKKLERQTESLRYGLFKQIGIKGKIENEK